MLHIFLAELEQHRHELSMKLTWKKQDWGGLLQLSDVLSRGSFMRGVIHMEREREREKTAKEEGK